MLPTLLSRSTLIPRQAGVGVLCNRIRLSRPLHSDAARVGRSRHGTNPPVAYEDLVGELNNVCKNASRNGLLVRPDGFVAVGQVINKSSLLRPTIFEQDGTRIYQPTITIGQVLRIVVNGSGSLTLLHEPRLHFLGDPESKMVWWIRHTKQPEVHKEVDQVTKRILPGTAVKNAIYKATTEEWDYIRVHGLRPPAGEEMIIMSPLDRIDEEDIKNTSYVYIFIDMEEAMKQGVEFFFTRHIQVVSPGDANGVILPQLFKDAVKVDCKLETSRPALDEVPENGDKPSGEQRYELH